MVLQPRPLWTRVTLGLAWQWSAHPACPSVSSPPSPPWSLGTPSGQGPGGQVEAALREGAVVPRSRWRGSPCWVSGAEIPDSHFLWPVGQGWRRCMFWFTGRLLPLSSSPHPPPSPSFFLSPPLGPGWAWASPDSHTDWGLNSGPCQLTDLLGLAEGGAWFPTGQLGAFFLGALWRRLHPSDLTRRPRLREAG